MKFLGILRASALCLLAIGFHGPRGILCSHLEVNPYTEVPTVEVSEISEDSTVKVRNLSPLDRAKELGVRSPSELEEFDVIDGVLVENSEAAKQRSEDIPESAIDLNFPVFAPEEDEEPFSADVSDISESPKESPVNSYESIPSSQSALVFESSTWHDSQLASAVLFLEEFCKKVEGYKFSGRLVDDLYESMKDSCSRASYYARSYTDQFMRSDLRDNPYKHILKTEEFNVYVEWMLENIPAIAHSLQHLVSEFMRLSEKQLESAISVVPAIYGFKVHDAWYDKDFMSSLRHKTSNLVNALTNFHERLEESSSIFSQSGLVFHSSTWDDSHLASAVLFLREFCKDVRDHKFHGGIVDENFKGISWTCSGVLFTLEPLIRQILPMYYPKTVAERKEIPKNFYEGKLKARNFYVYVKWLAENMSVIKGSFKKMLKESLKLTEEQLKMDTTVGPLKYGFVFVCENWKELIYRVLSTDYGQDFFLDLKDLQMYLKKSLKNSPKNCRMAPSTHEKSVKEELMQEISERRKKLVQRLLVSAAPFALVDMDLFLGMLKDNADVDPEAVQKVGEKINAFLGSLGIHGHDAKSSLEILMEKIREYHMDTSSSYGNLSSEERIAIKEIYEMLQEVPQSHGRPYAGECSTNEYASEEDLSSDDINFAENLEESTLEYQDVEDAEPYDTEKIFDRVI
ncbi:secreted antigen 1 [Babesia divergens]|uniref:Secreted antigen 1 n=1 Tax=Babesia divergens TaxID=32595 RepID=A0AAD9GDH1_BABDI|nr:secreted antigen 1 [Babesia divergens]